MGKGIAHSKNRPISADDKQVSFGLKERAQTLPKNLG